MGDIGGTEPQPGGQKQQGIIALAYLAGTADRRLYLLHLFRSVDRWQFLALYPFIIYQYVRPVRFQRPFFINKRKNTLSEDTTLMLLLVWVETNVRICPWPIPSSSSTPLFSKYLLNRCRYNKCPSMVVWLRRSSFSRDNRPFMVSPIGPLSSLCTAWTALLEILPVSRISLRTLMLRIISRSAGVTFGEMLSPMNFSPTGRS